jgi:hypothetical protein
MAALKLFCRVFHRIMVWMKLLHLRISTGFGSGMGRMCEVCGALTGAFMVVGLKYGKVITDGSKYGSDTETTYQKSQSVG